MTNKLYYWKQSKGKYGVLLSKYAVYSPSDTLVVETNTWEEADELVEHLNNREALTETLNSTELPL